MCTTRDAQPLAEPLGLRVEPGRRGHAPAEQAVDDDVDAAEVGQHVDVDLEVVGLGDQLADPARAHQLRQPGGPGLPARVAVVGDPEADVGVAALVARAGVHERAERHPAVERVGRVRGRARAAPAGVGVGDGEVGRVGDLLAAAVGVDHRVVHLRAVDVLRPVDAVGRRLLRRGGHREAGVRRQRELDRRAGERAADRVGLRVHHGAAEQHRRGLLGVGVGRRRDDARPADVLRRSARG